jgi:hypothetical protein
MTQTQANRPLRIMKLFLESCCGFPEWPEARRITDIVPGGKMGNNAIPRKKRWSEPFRNRAIPKLGGTRRTT